MMATIAERHAQSSRVKPREQIVGLRARVAELTAILRAKGVLTQADVDRIVTSPIPAPPRAGKQ